tara:strand:- start:490 stop:1590 length:1101 start_codon:yes stop_codon:yes gene_type:complete
MPYLNSKKNKEVNILLNFALLGCGKIAQRHSNLLGNNEISGAKLAAVCDAKIENAEIISKKFNVPCFSNMEKMMETCKIDVVVILTPSGLHAEHTIRLAKFGCDILVEKPMALTLSDADLMIEACDREGVKLFVVKQNRFNVPVVALRQALEDGRFGKLIMGTTRVRWCRHQAYYDQDSWRGTWAFDGGVLANQASHHIDLLEWMMGGVESVSAKSINALANIEAEDTAIALLKFKNGALGVIEATTAVRPKDLEGSLSILGEKGSVEIGGFAANELKTWNFSEDKEVDEKIFQNAYENPNHKYGYAHKKYYDHVVDCINGQSPQLVDGLQGRRSLELINTIYRSIETNSEINISHQSGSSKLGKI